MLHDLKFVLSTDEMVLAVHTVCIHYMHWQQSKHHTMNYQEKTRKKHYKYSYMYTAYMYVYSKSF